jgi:hypothetical protein
MNKKLSLTIITSLLLTACTTYTDVLQHKLAGKSDQEKRIILLQECKSKISENLKPNNKKSIQHAERMEEICEKMTGNKITQSTRK